MEVFGTDFKGHSYESFRNKLFKGKIKRQNVDVQE